MSETNAAETPNVDPIEAFTISGWKRHLRAAVEERKVFVETQATLQGVSVDAIQCEYRARALRLIRDASMDDLWKKLAASANDTKPFSRGSLHPPDWKRCLIEFAEALIYGHAARPLVQHSELEDIVSGLRKLRDKVRDNPCAAIIARNLLTARADERTVSNFHFDELGHLRATRQPERHALLLTESALERAIGVLSATNIADVLPGGPKTSFKGMHRDRNAVAFHLKYSVVPQWFDGPHHEAIARGLLVTRPDFDEMTADAVRRLLPVKAATGGNSGSN